MSCLISLYLEKQNCKTLTKDKGVRESNVGCSLKVGCYCKMLREFIHLTPIEGALGNGKESLVKFDLHKSLLWVTGMLVNMCPQHTVAVMAKKYIVFSYDMLSQLFSGFGTHGSGCKRKTFPVC